MSGNQPLYSQDGKLSLAVNGEIYNYLSLREEVGDESRFRTNSDCEPIVHLYEQLGDDVRQVSGTRCAFAAVKGAGSVITWGDADLSLIHI